ncbi:MAG: hypothetical protein WC864_07375 [Ilumatobacteraceae bacterium]
MRILFKSKVWKWIGSSTFIILLVLFFMFPFAGFRTKFGDVEDWSRYRPTQEKISMTDCFKKEYAVPDEEINKGVLSVLTLNRGFHLWTTSNPAHWMNEDFRGFLASKCFAGNLIPVRAYRDKLLWREPCTTQDTYFFGCRALEAKLLSWEQENAQTSSLEFNEQGLRFSIPPHLYHIKRSTLGGSADYSFNTEGPVLSDTSGIYIFLPLEEVPKIDVDPIGEIPDTAAWKMLNLGQLQGHRFEYQVQTQEDGYPWEGKITKEVFPVSYSDQPIVITYRHSVRDDTLETLWSNIHNEAEVNFEDNLGPYQHHVFQNESINAALKKNSSFY